MENTNNEDLVISAAALTDTLCQPGRLRRDPVAELLVVIGSCKTATCRVHSAPATDFSEWKSMTVGISLTTEELAPLLENGSFMPTLYEMCGERLWQKLEGAQMHDKLYICDDICATMWGDAKSDRFNAAFHIKYVLTCVV